MIASTTILLEQGEVGAEYAEFVSDAEGLSDVSVFIDRETWDLLGSPTELTVTIVPGDLLNSL